MATLYVPDAVYLDGALRFGATLAVDDGGAVSAEAPPEARRVEWPGRLVFPGLVNAHSHAFQRVLRGRTEVAHPGGGTDDFWTWREAMYDAAAALSPEALYLVSRQAFEEMARAGVTTVGEFHYLHHQPDGTPYRDRLTLALEVMRAANDVGLRLVLLRAAYARGGFGRALDPRQRRFVDPELGPVLDDVAALSQRAVGRCTVGLAPHSVRAVPKAWLEAIARRAGDGWPIHLHAAEQPLEVRQCLEEHGVGPIQLLDELGLLRPGTTVVHAIHLGAGDAERLARGGVRVCACPSTERSLGDGVVPADRLVELGVGICLGSDSQAQIDLLDEARQLEGHLRLVRGRRNVLAPPPGAPGSLGQRLLDAATVEGARSLGLEVGTLAPGRPADFFTVDRRHPSLVGIPPEALLAGVVFTAPQGSVREVAVQGRLIVRDGTPIGLSDPEPFAGVVRHLASISAPRS